MKTGVWVESWFRRGRFRKNLRVRYTFIIIIRNIIMAKKTYQEQMHSSYTKYPIVKSIPPSMLKSWGEGMQVLPSPLEIHEVMQTIPRGKVMTVKEVCAVLATKHKVDMACPYTTGILMNIVARAIEEDENDATPWWRTLGSNSEVKPKYPNAPEEQMALLEAEGFTFKKKGKKCVYWVVDKRDS